MGGVIYGLDEVAGGEYAPDYVPLPDHARHGGQAVSSGRLASALREVIQH